jgi:thymidylate synthase (FAD)
MVQFKFHIKAPLFVIRQWQRHRMSSYNELSARYSIIEDSFWIPEKLRKQDNINKQGSNEYLESNLNSDLINLIKDHQQDSYNLYEKLLSNGVSRELARTILPLSINSEFYWKIDLHNLLRFINLRNDHHAQYEIMQYACAIKNIVAKYCPITIEAYEEYIAESIKFSKNEINCINNETIPTGSKSSVIEFNDKISKIIALKNMYQHKE